MPARQRETQPAFFDGEASDQRNAARAIFKSVTVAALADIYAVHTRGYYAATRPNEAEFLQLVTPMTGLDRSTDRLTPAGRTSRDATVVHLWLDSRTSVLPVLMHGFTFLFLALGPFAILSLLRYLFWTGNVHCDYVGDYLPTYVRSVSY